MTGVAPITVRNLEFVTAADDVPRVWHQAGRAVTLFFNNLSLLFPAGERFFIRSVNAYKHRVTEPRLLGEVVDFCAQEAIHGREHRRYNDMLQRQGYPVAQMEGRVERLLRGVVRITPKRWRLAATCALEHYTASLAHLLLSDRQAMDAAHPTMAALWRWHALEENEHKAVAFDVYLAAGGKPFERRLVMFLATLIFWAKVLEQQFRLMAVDGIAFNLGEWRSLGRFLFRNPGGMGSLFRMYLDYYRRDFHPWQLDNRELLAQQAAETAS
jgi:predicted metal-dependent hydrolase